MSCRRGARGPLCRPAHTKAPRRTAHAGGGRARYRSEPAPVAAAPKPMPTSVPKSMPAWARPAPPPATFAPPELPPSPEAAVMAAREAARSAGTLDELRAILDRFEGAPCARPRDSSCSPTATRRRGSCSSARRRDRGGHRGPAVRRPLRQPPCADAAHDRGSISSPFTSPTSSLAAARQPHTGRRGNWPPACP